MNIIKLDATDSTNSFLRSLLSEGPVENMTTVVAEHQTGGRGQRGAGWHSQPGKNLTFSVYRRFENLPVGKQFCINMAVSLAIIDALNAIDIPDLKVKWPNDILSGSGKLAGILIENQIQSGAQLVIAGIGLNVNQLTFESLPRATSMQKVTGRAFDLDEVLQLILDKLELRFREIDDTSLQSHYESILFRKDKPSTFRKPNGQLIMGFIRGVDPYGQLIVEMEDQVRVTFQLKEIELLY